MDALNLFREMPPPPPGDGAALAVENGVLCVYLRRRKCAGGDKGTVWNLPSNPDALRIGYESLYHGIPIQTIIGITLLIGFPLLVYAMLHMGGSQQRSSLSSIFVAFGVTASICFWGGILLIVAGSRSRRGEGRIAVGEGQIKLDHLGMNSKLEPSRVRWIRALERRDLNSAGTGTIPKTWFENVPGALELELNDQRLRLFRGVAAVDAQWAAKVIAKALNIEQKPLADWGQVLLDGTPGYGTVLKYPPRRRGYKWDVDRRNKRPVLFIVGMIVVSLMVGILTLPISASYTLRTLNWTKTRGEVLTPRYRDIQTGRQSRVEEDFHYRYEVGSREYKNDRVSPLFENFMPGPADFIRMQKPEAQVTVYYNPDNPSQSILQPESSWLILLSVGFIAFGVSGLLVIWSQRRRWWIRPGPLITF